MTSKPNSKPQRRDVGRIVLIALTLTSLSGTLAMGVLYFGQKSDGAYAQNSAGAEPLIPPGVSLTSWADNGKGGEHVLQIAQGSVPAGVRLVGTVKTDTDCDPDAQGVNHCHNIIALDNGGSIEVIHNHVMHRYPCLDPGQRLAITQLNSNWVLASEGGPRPLN